VDISFPAGCFSWGWNKIFSDQALHTPNSAELAVVHAWLEGGPHLTSDSEHVNKTTFFRICLGMGIILKDVNLIQFTEEGGHSEETPAYITQSAWGTPELLAFGDYFQELRSVLVR